MKVLLVSPPFSQLNTPYPATCYLKGYLQNKGFIVDQKDLGIIVIDKIFSRKGLTRIFNKITTGRIGALKDSYLNSIDPVMDFLRGNNQTLAHKIIQSDYLPQSTRFDTQEDSSFSDMDISDHARYLSTLYLNDIGDYIQQNIDPGFGFSRYSEKLAFSPGSFDTIEKELNTKPTIIKDIILEEWEKVLTHQNANIIGITIPFPGNLVSSLLIAEQAKKKNPNIKIVIGGGWVNTELRSLTDTKIFKYVDYIVLDDGENPFELIIESIKTSNPDILHRTYTLTNNIIKYHFNPKHKDTKINDLPAPDYAGLDLTLYISLLDSTNPMHSLWNRGLWNKLTLAHGCYWKRCAFCDTSLPYIADFHQSSAKIVVDKIETIMNQTGESGFHFVDEAAPPALLKELSLELLRRKLSITWWTNIRFETRFTSGLAKLMAKSGCIAVSGGVEVASDRLLSLMDKGVTVNQVAQVTGALGQEGIMVHAYLMYGFPTETIKETIDALEIVRQLFKLNLIQSAYWHQFSLTAHSPVGHNPEQFELEITGPKFNGFARNDLEFNATTQDPAIFSEGLKTSLYNYMRGNGLEAPLSTWFKFPIPKTKIKKNYLKRTVDNKELELENNTQLIWLGEKLEFRKNEIYLYDNTSQEIIKGENNEISFIKELTDLTSYTNNKKTTMSDIDMIANKNGIDPDLWLGSNSASTLISYGLIFI